MLISDLPALRPNRTLTSIDGVVSTVHARPKGDTAELAGN